MPTYGFTLAVLIRRQPHFVSVFSKGFEFLNDLFLVFRNDITRLVVIINVNTHILLLKVPDMAVATLYLEVFAQNFFYRLRFRRRLHNQ